MSSFSDDFASAGAPQLFEHFGESVTYKPASASEDSDTSIESAVVGPEKRNVINSEDGREVRYTRHVSLVVDSDSDYYCGLSADDIHENATIDIGGTEYLVDGFKSVTPPVVVVIVSRTGQLTKTRTRMHRG